MNVPVEEPKDGWSGENERIAEANGHGSWQAWAEEVADEVGHKVCGARVRDDRPCRLAPRTGRPRCKRHGGGSLIGAAHPQARDLSRSKYVPGRLREAFEASLADPRQRDLAPQIAACDARELELWQRLPRGESDETWTRLRAAWKAWRRAAASGDPDRVARATENLDAVVREGSSEALVWRELRENGEHRRKLVDTMVKVESVERDSVSRARLAALTVALAEGYRRAVTDNVSDRRERRRTLVAMAEFTGGLLGEGRLGEGLGREVALG